MAPLNAAVPHVMARAHTLDGRARKGELEVDHLRERTLSTFDGYPFQLAMSPWRQNGEARGCYVAVACEGRIFASYVLWECARTRTRQLTVLAGFPDHDVTLEVHKHLRAVRGWRKDLPSQRP